jgi:hypothetical protein
MYRLLTRILNFYKFAGFKFSSVFQTSNIRLTNGEPDLMDDAKEEAELFRLMEQPSRPLAPDRTEENIAAAATAERSSSALSIDAIDISPLGGGNEFAQGNIAHFKVW